MSAPGNTFEAPPRSSRVPDLPPPPLTRPLLARPPLPPPLTVSAPTPPDASSTFAPSLPPMKVVKRNEVHTLPPGSSPASLVAPTPHAGRPSPQPSPAMLFSPGSDAPATIHRKQRRRGVFVSRMIWMVTLMGLVVGGLWGYQKYVDSQIPHPDAWDPRAVPIVEFVERTRGLQFDHPVYIDFLAPPDFMARFGDSADAPHAPPPEQRAYESELLDALGLTDGRDAVAAQSTLSAAVTLGAYTPSTDRIIVRGDQLTPAVRTTLAHELTHALQAQHFDLLGRSGEVGMRAAAEADAMRVEQQYLESLPPDEQAAAKQEQSVDVDDTTLDSVPWTMVELAYAPYILGPQLVGEVFETGGNAGVDELMKYPPTDEQLISPWSWHPATAPDIAATDAEATAGSTIIEHNSKLSVLQVLVAMDAWLSWSMARGALDTWVSGTYTTYRATPTGPLCVAIAAAFSDRPEVFRDAVMWWSGAMGVPTTATLDGSTVHFSLCARGPASTLPPKPVVSTTLAIVIEAAAVPSEADTPQKVQSMLCAARKVIDDPGLAPLLQAATTTPDQDATLQRAFMEAAASCGA